MFNMEFFYDAPTDRLTVIEFNPRMASQFSDLYLRVAGVDLHACSLALAHGLHPDSVLRATPVAGAASSLVYRTFTPEQACAMPDAAQVARFEAAYPGGMLFRFPKDGGSMARDFKWLGSYRYAIIHLGGSDGHDLRHVTTQSLRDQLSIVPQEGHLFAGTGFAQGGGHALHEVAAGKPQGLDIVCCTQLAAKRVTLLRSGEKNAWLEVVLDEGKNRHIRRLLEANQINTLRLMRVAIGGLALGELAKGEWRELSAAEVAGLKN